MLLNNRTLETAFTAQYCRLKVLCSSTGFTPGAFKGASKLAMQTTLSRRLMDLAGIRGLGCVYNGTNFKIAEKIAKAGMVNVKKKDDGFFGSGCYASFQPAYAALYPSVSHSLVSLRCDS